VCLLVNLLFSICFAIGYIHSGEIKIFIFILTSVGSGLERERESGRTEQHAAVVEQVAEVLEHRSLVDASSSTEVAQEPTTRDHHVSRRVLYNNIAL